MAAEVKFEDFSVKATEALKKAAIAGLEEAANEIQTQAARNSRIDEGQLKGSWKHTIDESKMEATIGSPLENAIWEEFGTGEYALEGKGRKGGWFIPAEKLSPKSKTKMRKFIIKGKEFYFTRGKTPNRTLRRAFDSKKGVAEKLIKRSIQKAMKGGSNE